MRRLFPILLLLCAACLLASCNATRRVPTGQYLLVKNKVKVDRDKELARDEVVHAETLEPFIRQHPNKRFLGTNFYIWVYNQANPAKDNGWNRFKRRVGQAPVLLDTLQVQRTAREMKIFMDGRGFLDARTHYEIDSARRKARVTYYARQNQPYRIGTISYDFRDRLVESVIMEDSAATLLRSGNLFDISVLDNERVRITDYLKARGYYDFTINNISYVADSTAGDRTVNLTMVVRQHLAGYDQFGDPVLDNNQIYRIRDIYVYPNYDPTVATTDSLYLSRLDTVQYRGLNIVYDTRQNVRSEILRRTINLYPNYLYDADQVKRTYDKIMRLGYFRSASILFSPEEPADTVSAGDNLVTFVGSGDDSVAYAREAYLNCNILCTPALRQSYSIELEGTTSSSYYGVNAKLGYQNRNLFRGVEQFDVSLRLGYEFMRAKGQRRSFEIGGSVSFSFPRFITPFRVDPFNRSNNPRTRVELSYDVQHRPYYERTLSSGVWGYSWGSSQWHRFILNPIDISIVKLNRIDEDFLNGLANPYLQNSYTSQIIAGLSAAYIYNNQRQGVARSSTSLRVNLETNGNLINGLSAAFGKRRSGDDYFRLFGVRYAQYLRTDVNVVRRFVFTPKTSLVYRFYTGLGYAYGNSESVPFERLFYAGGSNSMRGWLARTLGPGDQPKPVPEPGKAYFPRQLGNFKLETNLELRFPVWGFLNGAVFADVGNIWFAIQGGETADEKFRFNRFFKQLGFNTGLGARLDFDFFVFRVDWGIKLHDPNEPVGQRWIQNFRLSNTTLSFGVGYPF